MKRAQEVEKKYALCNHKGRWLGKAKLTGLIYAYTVKGEWKYSGGKEAHSGRIPGHLHSVVIQVKCELRQLWKFWNREESLHKLEIV